MKSYVGSNLLKFDIIPNPNTSIIWENSVFEHFSFGKNSCCNALCFKMIRSCCCYIYNSHCCHIFLPLHYKMFFNLVYVHLNDFPTGSVPSLAAGLLFGGLAGFGAYQISQDPRNIWVSLGLPFPHIIIMKWISCLNT